jgi:hypothetical protein
VLAFAKPPAIDPLNARITRYAPYLGSTYITSLTDATAHAIMVIGKDRWSLARFVSEVGSAHLRAARTITRIAQLHSAKSVRHFYDNSSPASVAEAGFGVACLFTLFRTFESQGFDVTRWARSGTWADKASTFATFKKRETRAAAVEHAAAPPRAAADARAAAADKRTSRKKR